MIEPEQKNLYLAIITSMIFYVVWFFFYESPRLATQQAAKLSTQSNLNPTNQTPNSLLTAEDGADNNDLATSTNELLQPYVIENFDALTRQKLVGENKRVPLENQELIGSINLKGGMIDDIMLKNYHLTIDKNSPLIKLFSPEASKHPYHVTFGWLSRNKNLNLPDHQAQWKLVKGSTLSPGNPIVIETRNKDGSIVLSREIKIDNNSMLFVTESIHNKSNQTIEAFNYGLIKSVSRPKILEHLEADALAITKEEVFNYDAQTIYILHEGFIGFTKNSGLIEESYEDVIEQNKIYTNPNISWAGLTSKYWASSLIPIQNDRQTQPNPAFSPPQPSPEQNLLDGESQSGSVSKLSFRQFFNNSYKNQRAFQVDILRNQVSLAPGQSSSAGYMLFAGPKKADLIEKYQTDYNIKRFDLMIDWGWFYYLTFYLFKALTFLFEIFGNFGISILVLTIGVKALFFPLANKSYVSMSKMKILQPKMKALQEKHKDDKIVMQQSLAKLYRDEKVNPLAGCLPILLQIPVFFALYKVIYVTIEMRHAPFFGWIQDLSAPDPTSFLNLFGLLPFEASSFLAIGVWPILMGITMFAQMRLNPEPSDPTQAMIFKWMPVVFTFLLASFPAGLVIYWTWNNTLSIIQQAYIMNRYGTPVRILDDLNAIFNKNKKSDKNDKN